MLGQIANYAPVMTRASIVKNSTSLSSVLHVLRQHYRFQRTGAQFLKLHNTKRADDDHTKDLFQRRCAFFHGNLLQRHSSITHHGEAYGN